MVKAQVRVTSKKHTARMLQFYTRGMVFLKINQSGSYYRQFHFAEGSTETGWGWSPEKYRGVSSMNVLLELSLWPNRGKQISLSVRTRSNQWKWTQGEYNSGSTFWKHSQSDQYHWLYTNLYLLKGFETLAFHDIRRDFLFSRPTSSVVLWETLYYG